MLALLRMNTLALVVYLQLLIERLNVEVGESNLMVATSMKCSNGCNGWSPARGARSTFIDTKDSSEQLDPGLEWHQTPNK